MDVCVSILCWTLIGRIMRFELRYGGFNNLVDSVAVA